MAVPAQVKKQTEDINKLYDDLNAESEGGDETPPTDPVESQQLVVDGEPEPAPIPDGDETPPDGGQSDETFEQKYRTLQGMYNAEVPTLTASNRDLNSRVAQLEGLLSSVNVQPTAEPQPTVSKPESLISEADVEEYGDSIGVMRKAAREEFRPISDRISTLENTVKQLSDTVLPRMEQISQQHHQTAEQVFWAGLAKEVPEWNAINNSPDFQTWLLEIDPMTGVTRQSHLENAQQSLDLGRVSSFFKLWSELSGPPVSPQEPKAPSSQLEKQIVPGRSRAKTTSSEQVKTYTRDDITQFFDDVRTGRFLGREDERNRIERDIFAAQAEGRIVNA